MSILSTKDIGLFRKILQLAQFSGIALQQINLILLICDLHSLKGVVKCHFHKM